MRQDDKKRSNSSTIWKTQWSYSVQWAIEGITVTYESEYVK